MADEISAGISSAGATAGAGAGTETIGAGAGIAVWQPAINCAANAMAIEAALSFKCDKALLFFK